MNLPSMFRRKRSWLERTRDFLDDLRDHDVTDDDEPDDDELDDEAEPTPFAGLHWMTAGLFIAAGIEAAAGERRGDYRAGRSVRWAPLLAAPAAATAHALRASHPTRTTRVASQVLDGIAVGVGTVGIASSLVSALHADEYETVAGRPARVPSIAPLTFCAVGLLAILLNDEEEEFEKKRARLERRARMVERLIPERKARVDRIVIHA